MRLTSIIRFECYWPQSVWPISALVQARKTYGSLIKTVEVFIKFKMQTAGFLAIQSVLKSKSDNKS